MSVRTAIPQVGEFISFGHMLKYLRRRAQLTQRQLGLAVGYSEAQISRMEHGHKPPDLCAITALFVPALDIQDQPETAGRLVGLAASARGEGVRPPSMAPSPLSPALLLGFLALFGQSLVVTMSASSLESPLAPQPGFSGRSGTSDIRSSLARSTLSHLDAPREPVPPAWPDPGALSSEQHGPSCLYKMKNTLLPHWVDLVENLGKKGPGDGEIVYETELAGTGRLVMEQKVNLVTGKNIFAVTTVVNNSMIITSYFTTQGDAMEHVDAVRLLLQAARGQNPKTALPA